MFSGFNACAAAARILSDAGLRASCYSVSACLYRDAAAKAGCGKPWSAVACKKIWKEINYTGSIGLELGHPEPYEEGVRAAMTLCEGLWNGMEHR